MQHWVVQQGLGTNDQPTPANAEGAQLREYIWNRLINSLEDNA
jgi:hypothetical protein